MSKNCLWKISPAFYKTKTLVRGNVAWIDVAMQKLYWGYCILDNPYWGSAPVDEEQMLICLLLI